jgi:hypothetical protein
LSAFEGGGKGPCPFSGSPKEKHACTRPSNTSRRGRRGRQRRLGLFNGLNKINQRPSFIPKWSDKPLLKSTRSQAAARLRAKPTRSARNARAKRGRRFWTEEGRQRPLNEKVGEIKVTILERDGKILMVKDCPIHGHFEDVMAMDTAFFKHLEEVSRAATSAPTTTRSCTIRQQHDSARRGSVLTVDLTNRCNMMCDPLHGREPGRLRPRAVVGRHPDGAGQRDQHQAAAADVGPVLRWEPTISPHFLDAVRYARKVGYNSVQAATNGIEFARARVRESGGGRGSALRVSAV